MPAWRTGNNVYSIQSFSHGSSGHTQNTTGSSQGTSLMQPNYTPDLEYMRILPLLELETWDPQIFRPDVEEVAAATSLIFMPRVIVNTNVRR